MSDPSLPLQAALVAALKGNVGSAVGAKVYDQVPTAPVFPYVSLGDAQVVPDKAGCIDGADVYVQIDVWSRAVGYPETKTIAAAIVAKLDDKPLTVTGHDVVIMEHQGTQYLRDPDGLSRHAALTFHASIYPV